MKKTSYFLVIALAAAIAFALNGCSKKEKEKEKLSVEDAISEIVGEYRGEIISDDFVYSTSDKSYLSAFKKNVDKHIKSALNGNATFKVTRIGEGVVEFDCGLGRLKSKDIVNLSQSVCMNVDDNTKAYEDDSEGLKLTLLLFPIINPDTKDKSGRDYSVYYSKKDKQISATLNAEMKFVFTQSVYFEGSVRCKTRVRGTKK